jgi:hypothetical protein
MDGTILTCSANVTLSRSMARRKKYEVRGSKADQVDEERIVIACADDSAVLMHCYALLKHCERAEAWDGDRLVCRMTRAGHSVGPKRTI